MHYRAINVFDSRNQVVVEYQAVPSFLEMLLGMQPTVSMARGKDREWVEERAQSLSQLTEHRLRGPIVDFLEATYHAFKKSAVAA